MGDESSVAGVVMVTGFFVDRDMTIHLCLVLRWHLSCTLPRPSWCP